jgi:hypothetical protein
MQPTHFESCELKPYAHPVSASDLKEGVIYFFVNFSDDAMLIPTMEPVVFIGRNLDANDGGAVYFQDIDSYQQGVRYCSPAENENENAMIYSGSENEMGHVFEFDHALEELMRCALRRRTMRK